MNEKNKLEGSGLKMPTIKVVGIGGGGGNAVSRMARSIRGVEFIAINTDLQDLGETIAKIKLPIGKSITRGMGAGMNPDIGRQAAEENREDISRALSGADLVFITCGLGGGTGSGASPVVADCCREVGAISIAVVTKPFLFEGSIRRKIAEDAWKTLASKVDAIITIPNDRVFNIISRTTPLLEAFEKIDEILKNAVGGISDLISKPGFINVDFADIRAVITQAGPAVLGIGVASGQDRAHLAAKNALNSPLLDLSIDGARGILFNISGRENLTMSEVNEVAQIIIQSADQDAKIIFGATIDPKIRANEIKVTVIATGFDKVSDSQLPFNKEVKINSSFQNSAILSSSTQINSGTSQIKRENSSEIENSDQSPMSIALKELLENKLSEDKEFETPAFFRRKKKTSTF
jgi:cell division protein FtsZ